MQMLGIKPRSYKSKCFNHSTISSSPLIFLNNNKAVEGSQEHEQHSPSPETPGLLYVHVERGTHKYKASTASLSIKEF